MKEKWLTTDYPNIYFENTKVGQLKKKLFDAPMNEIEEILKEYDIPSPSELGKGGSYIQNSPRMHVIEERRKDDIVFVPVGCTECHGDYANTGLDTFMVTQICEGIRRYCKKKGNPVSLAIPPLNYGAHPYHHCGMAGTIIMPEDVVRETMINVMFGLWNDGFRKQIWVNNHGQLWVLESALQEFCKRYQLPGIYRVIDWHRAIREFFIPIDRKDSLSTDFVHADEAEASVGLLLFPEMLDMKYAVDTEGESLLPGGHFDTSVDPFRRPQQWQQGEGQSAIERSAVPEGVVGKPTRATVDKAKRPIAAILKYLTLVHDEILENYPSGKLPPVEKISLRDPKEMEPFLKEPMSKGWKSVFELPYIGQINSL
jgi:3-dehydro-scyllo-inosose hydrolase